MGGRQSKSLEQIEEEKRANDLNIELINNAIQDVYNFKILLLGAGESGKSTVLKQLKSIFNIKNSSEDWKVCADSLHFNITLCVQQIIKHADSLFLKDDEKKSNARTYLDQTDQETVAILEKHEGNEQVRYSAEEGERIKRLLQSKPIVTAYEERDKYWIPDSAQYYFDHITRICHPSFKPTEEDYLSCRVRTTGIIETNFEKKLSNKDPMEPDSIKFKVFDVGGQKSERRKWKTCFEPPSVDAVLFIVNCAGYNQVMYENPAQNRLEEELEVFKWLMMQKQYVGNVPVFLFLNKKDLFEQMILKKDLGDKFNDYHGGCNSQKALEYIKQRFSQLHPEQGKLKIEFVSAKLKKDIREAFMTVTKDLYQDNREVLMKRASAIRKKMELELAEKRKLENPDACC